MPLLVEKIENGTVIDRISAGRGIRVLTVLGLSKGTHGGRVALLVNVPSKKMGKKDILKIEGIFLGKKSASKVALISPHARVNIVKNGKVESKETLSLPDEVVDVGKCPNPKCITNSDEVETRFRLEGKQLRCSFCERLFNADELV